MGWILWTLLFLPCIALADINIYIYVGDNETESSIRAEGEIREVIPEEERKAWNLLDEPLKVAIRRRYGKIPTYVYVKSPTPRRDIYTYKGWEQVTRTLVPVSARILNITEEEQRIYATNRKYNNEITKIPFIPCLYQEIDQSVSSHWSVASRQLKLGQAINYNVTFQIDKTKVLLYTSDWSKDVSQQLSDSVSLKTGFSVNIQPSQQATAELSMKRSTMYVQVEYRATLTGEVSSNYPKTWQSVGGPVLVDHYRHHPVNQVLGAMAEPTVTTGTEVIRIRFFSDARITVTNMVSPNTRYTTRLTSKAFVVNNESCRQ